MAHAASYFVTRQNYHFQDIAPLLDRPYSIDQQDMSAKEPRVRRHVHHSSRLNMTPRLSKLNCWRLCVLMGMRSKYQIDPSVYGEIQTLIKAVIAATFRHFSEPSKPRLPPCLFLDGVVSIWLRPKPTKTSLYRIRPRPDEII